MMYLLLALMLFSTASAADSLNARFVDPELDVATWVKDGLIDDLLPTGQVFDEQDIHRDDPDNLDFDFFARLEGRQNVRLMPLL